MNVGGLCIEIVTSIATRVATDYLLVVLRLFNSTLKLHNLELLYGVEAHQDSRIRYLSLILHSVLAKLLVCRPRVDPSGGCRIKFENPYED